jgi:uncharacterized membrane-anchored protein YhcB (DUF1043 family)
MNSYEDNNATALSELKKELDELRQTVNAHEAKIAELEAKLTSKQSESDRL